MIYSLFSYRLTLTSSPEQLPQVTPRYNQVRLSTPSGNAGAVYLSSSPVDSEATSLRFAIAAGKHFPLKISNLNLLYAYGTSGDCLDVLCEEKRPKAEVKITEGGSENEPSNNQ